MISHTTHIAVYKVFSFHFNNQGGLDPQSWTGKMDNLLICTCKTKYNNEFLPNPYDRHLNIPKTGENSNLIVNGY